MLFFGNAYIIPAFVLQIPRALESRKAQVWVCLSFFFFDFAFIFFVGNDTTVVKA